MFSFKLIIFFTSIFTTPRLKIRFYNSLLRFSVFRVTLIYTKFHIKLGDTTHWIRHCFKYFFFKKKLYTRKVTRTQEKETGRWDSPSDQNLQPSWPLASIRWYLLHGNNKQHRKNIYKHSVLHLSLVSFFYNNTKHQTQKLGESNGESDCFLYGGFFSKVRPVWVWMCVVFFNELKL